MIENIYKSNGTVRPLDSLGPRPIEYTDSRSPQTKRMRRIGAGLAATVALGTIGALTSNSGEQGDTPKQGSETPVTTIVEAHEGDTLPSLANEQADRLGQDPIQVYEQAQKLNPDSVEPGNRVALPSTEEHNKAQ